MPDPLTPTIRLTQPTVGGDSGTWGGLLNSDMTYVDEAINQSVTVAIADTNVTLTADGSSSDQARYLRYNFTGALTADRTVTLPANVKVGWASNNTTGGHSVILSAGGTTLSLTDTSWRFFYCDGTNVTAPSMTLGAIAATDGTALSGTTGQIAAATVTVAGGYAAIYAKNSGVSAGATAITARTDLTTGVLINFLFGTTTVGSVAQNGGTGVTYNVTSDQRLKIDGGLIEAEASARIIAALRPRWFRWKVKPGADPEPGFFAQQVWRVFPWAVTKPRRKGEPWQMDAGKLMPVVVAELQSLRRRVAKLERAR